MNKKFFGWTGSYFPFVLLFSVILVLSVSVTNVMGAVYDDFNGDNINQTLWKISDDGGILSQSEGLLHADGPPNSMYGYLRSKYEFRGDFEFVLDYRDFQTTATIFAGNCASIDLQVDVEGGSGNFIFIFRGLCQDGHTFFSNGEILGSWQSGFEASASTQSGLLKITRTGSTITTYYDEGTGWNSLGSFPGAFTGDVNIQIRSYSGDDGIFHVSSDWITYEGQIISPVWGTAYNTLFDGSSDLELLRQYRDEILSKKTKGGMYKTLLYMSSEEALEVFLDNPELMLEAKYLIETNKDAVLGLLNGDEGVIYNTDEIISFLDVYAEKSPPALKTLANMVKRAMLTKQKQGKLFLGFKLR